ncbi:MAG TPA: xanthine dehydrogenase family protein molybdopterin-binding subunit, partial [Geminicoccaceae bacterium]|nr:xanthine dehydrogenase family protein molybdopterin-binding subunit [Geminicoccaceae bacterium]
RRVEDQRLITGRGRYTDDITLPNQAHAYVLRSPHAFARIVSIDTTAAASAEGVLAVLTGADAEADGLGNLPCPGALENMPTPPRPVLARDRVRFVGDPVAVIVAGTAARARDAAELVEVDYEELPAVTDLAAAEQPGRAQIWDFAPHNVVFRWEAGDREPVDRLIAGAARVVTVDLVNNRVVANSLEPRCANGAYDPQSGRYTLYTTSQGAHGIRGQLAEHILKVPEDQIHVAIPDVGGGFGMKIFLYPEHGLMLWAAKRVGRPVKWYEDRSEAFLSDTHGRDHITRAQLALDADGRFLALRASITANLGAYLSQYGPFIPTGAGAAMYAGVYDFQAVHVESKGLYTNTSPVDAYRGAGRPEAAYVVERLVDTAARELGMDPAELRRRNFIKPERMPYKTHMGAASVTYDSGEFARNLNDALELADAKGFPARRSAARAKGRLRGLGISYYIEQCGGAPEETARIELDAEGGVKVFIGNKSNGQGHETAYTQLVSDALGVDSEQIEVVQADTDRTPAGMTGGSRALPVGGVATRRASDEVVEKAKRVASDMLEAAATDLRFEDGRFTVVGTDRSVGLLEVAARAGGLDGRNTFTPDASTFPNGCHVCEIEVDIDTGTPEVVRYTVVDDFGRVVNPLLVAGQVHGGVAQGVGQALYEHAVYDPESGQLLSGSYMDYCMPRADNLTEITFKLNEIACTTNPLGAKGCGEAGAIGAPPAVINALVDALHEYGVKHVDMPATPLRLWRLINERATPMAAE